MKRKIELLAPGGDIDSIKAAIAAGADAVYCGLDRFNARNRATNISFEALNGVINLAHGNNCKVFLTLNIVVVGSEVPALVRLLNKLVNTNIDGVIVQDFGVFYLLSRYFKGLDIHASTQLNTHNDGQVKFLSKLTASRVNLSRELNLDEIKALALTGHRNNTLTEVFVHGSYCISFSGICYMSSVHGGKSGNRGKCSQPCRDRYLTTPEGKNYPLNLKDNSAYSELRELSEAGVASVKIEGRIKGSDYVYTVVDCWRKQIRSFYEQDRLNDDSGALYKVFNRDFSNAYLKGDINKNMFIDNPRDNSIKQLSDISNYPTNKKMEENHIRFYEEKAVVSAFLKEKFKELSVAKIPLRMDVSGKFGAPLRISVKTPDTSFTVFSENNLLNAGTDPLIPQGRNRKADAGTVPPGEKKLPRKDNGSADRQLDHGSLLKRFRSLNDAAYHIQHMETGDLQSDLFISYKELTSLRKRILSRLNGSKAVVDPIDVPFLKKPEALKTKPALCVLISSQKDLHLCHKTSADIFFRLPDAFEDEYHDLLKLFADNRALIPWFPSVLIGESYTAAAAFLKRVKPRLIVTNNTGIAHEACENEIPWIAGPNLNIVNSFSLLCLKEKFNCSGSFISNEINRKQIKSIVRPGDFKLYYSIYHPVSLMTSRQCLLRQVIGCEKERIDDECIQTCNRSSSITDLKKVPFIIDKTKGNYHRIYNNINFLNAEIVTDMPGGFSGFSIDLRDIKTETTVQADKSDVIRLFENLLNGKPDSKADLKRVIQPATNAQYQKGI